MLKKKKTLECISASISLFFFSWLICLHFSLSLIQTARRETNRLWKCLRASTSVHFCHHSQIGEGCNRQHGMWFFLFFFRTRWIRSTGENAANGWIQQTIKTKQDIWPVNLFLVSCLRFIGDRSLSLFLSDDCISLWTTERKWPWLWSTACRRPLAKISTQLIGHSSHNWTNITHLFTYPGRNKPVYVLMANECDSDEWISPSHFMSFLTVTGHFDWHLTVGSLTEVVMNSF